MSTLTIDTPWSDGATLTEAFLDNVKDDTELFVNVTGLTGADNIQALHRHYLSLGRLQRLRKRLSDNNFHLHPVLLQVQTPRSLT